MKKQAALSSIVCSSPADVDWSMVPSGREMMPFGAFVVVVVSTGSLLLAAEAPCEKEFFRLLGWFLGFLAIFEKCKALY